MSTETDDPILEAQIEAEIARALGPVEGTLPPEILDEMRMLMRLGLRYNPGARELLDQLRPVATADKSDKVATAAFKNRKKTRSGGGR